MTADSLLNLYFFLHPNMVKVDIMTVADSLLHFLLHSLKNKQALRDAIGALDWLAKDGAN